MVYVPIAPFTLTLLDQAKRGSLSSTYQTMSVNGLIWARNGMTLDYL